MKHKYILILLSFAIIASATLAFVNIGGICGEVSGCVTVKNSIYSNIFGISTALIGFIAIIIVAAIAIFDKNKKTNNLLKAGLTIGAIGAVFFIYLQFFVIGAICKYCMITDISLIFAVIIFFLLEKK